MKTNTNRLHRGLLRLLILVMLVTLVAIPAFAADWDGALRAIQEGMKHDQTEIDISAYDLPAGQFWDQYGAWLNSGKFPWYVRQGGNGWKRGDYMTAVTPNYLDPVAYNRATYEAKVSQVIKETVHAGMSGWQIALSVHDYLAAHCEYDQRWYSGATEANYEGYDCLVKGLAVCDGYTKAYMDIMKRVGIPCLRVVSGDDAMDHSWNLIKLNGNWYHVDVTWDDPSFSSGNGGANIDMEGYVKHEFFLLSDATIADADHRHYGWTAPYKCTATNYELTSNPYWNGVTSQIIWTDDTVSFWRSGDNRTFQIKRRDANTGISTVLAEISVNAIDVGTGSRYFYWSYGLSNWNGMLYFSDPSRVYRVSMAGGEPEVVYTHNHSDGRYIQGCSVRNGVAYLTMSTHGGVRSELQKPVPTPSHIHVYTALDVKPTCKAAGYTRFTCSCGSFFDSGHLDPDPNAHVYRQTERVEPTVWDEGYVISVCTVCGQSKTEILQAKGNPFTDVRQGTYCYQPVLWAVDRGITSGVSATEFAPNNNCTRGQVVTFLWRSVGCPEPRNEQVKFTDLDPKAFYYKAVLWAVQNGITAGLSETSFGPGETCTRGQVVTFLYRTMGKPAVSSAAHQFTDVSATAFYYTPMLWAVQNGVTAGITATAFAPNNSCTRGQIVTFLFRAV